MHWVNAKQHKTHFLKNKWWTSQFIFRVVLKDHLNGIRALESMDHISPFERFTQRCSLQYIFAMLASSSREPQTLFLFKSNLPSLPSADKSTSKRPIHAICVLQQQGCWPLSSNANGSKADYAGKFWLKCKGSREKIKKWVFNV